MAEDGGGVYGGMVQFQVNPQRCDIHLIQTAGLWLGWKASCLGSSPYWLGHNYTNMSQPVVKVELYLQNKTLQTGWIFNSALKYSCLSVHNVTCVAQSTVSASAKMNELLLMHGSDVISARPIKTSQDWNLEEDHLKMTAASRELLDATSLEWRWV